MNAPQTAEDVADDSGLLMRAHVLICQVVGMQNRQVLSGGAVEREIYDGMRQWLVDFADGADETSTAQALVDACAPYLKDGETPAECIARNRKDVDIALSLLGSKAPQGVGPEPADSSAGTTPAPNHVETPAPLDAGLRFKPVLERASNTREGWTAEMEQAHDGEWVHIGAVKAGEEHGR
jgi:hypothetical protein